MILSNMNEKDWANYFNSIAPLSDKDIDNDELPNIIILADAPKPVFPTSEPVTVTSEVDSQTIETIKVMRETGKAKFFVTQESFEGTYGFWCPKRTILAQTVNSVTVPGWFNISVIEFT